MRKLALITLFFGAALAANGQALTKNATRSVRVTVQGYIAINLDAATLSVNNALPGQINSGSVGFKVTSNGAWTVSVLPVTKPSTYSGPASFAGTTNIPGGNAGALIPGTLTVTVTGLSYGDLAKNYPGGSVIIQVAQS
ncbi:MAG TPA: hypothetical protein VK934_05425 [Fimbriimonas sp.]|nr:hypothetical protein [Fimbriimonas sp.]